MQLLGEACGTFSWQPSRMEIPPGLSSSLTVNFTPKHAVNYHTHAAFLLLHGDPIVVTLLGTGYTPAAQPFPLQPLDIAAVSPFPIP